MMAADQAEQLRNKFKFSQAGLKRAKTIAITSGKGGVGKSNFSLNFALSLIEKGKRVLLFDLDIGMGNIDVLLGLAANHHFTDMFYENLAIHDIIESGPNTLSYISGGSGLSGIFNLDSQRYKQFIEQFELLVSHYDYILFDMGAGATDDSLAFISAADETIVVTTPEPTSITDAYAMIKHINLRNKHALIHLLINRVDSEKEGRRAFTRLQSVVSRFLECDVILLGILPDDKHVKQAVSEQTPFILRYQKCQVSKSLHRLTRTFVDDRKAPPSPTSSSFLTKLKRLVTEG
ncbi:MinD/ParA family protein [Thalassobacillus sp. CUG 92003]|uniref:MinD/ParA family protein n=1 Tax=Thalassobacillus sp. CUG 92003 TaxID=2736641 RepID=UPI00210222A0|nr:MinD/ParA family protein [Thalassobacillus sp. CUG 92003]